MVRFNIKSALFMGLLCTLGLQAPFSIDDVALARQLADKFTVTAAQQSTFLAKAQGLVATFSSATNEQRASVIEAIEDARFGGTMTSIQSPLDTLLATAKATPAGVASVAPATTSTGTNATGTTGSAGTSVVTSVATTYVDRIAALQALIDGFRFKKPSDADKVQVMSVVQSIFADRGESFSDERQRLSQTLSNAKVLVYRDDVITKPQIDALITQLATVVPFDVQLATQKQLYSIFTPLTQIQKARVLKHFQEMTSMAPSLTDISLNNDFHDLLQFANVALFQDDPSAHAQMTSMLSKTATLDPVFAKPYGDIISAFKTSAPTVASLDIPAFITKIQTLVTMRYGNKVGDDLAKVPNCAALQDLLNTLISLPPFSASVPQLTVWLGMVKADNISTAAQSFGDRIAAYANPDFMTQTYDATKRAAFLVALDQLMKDRYGSSDADRTTDAIALNKRKLRQLLSWMVQISWFSSNLAKLNSYIALVDQDPATAPAVGTTLSLTVTPTTTLTTTLTPTTGAIASGVFNVSFGGDISTQLSLLEQSQGAINSDNHRELFLLSLFDVVGRKSAATTVDVARMRALATNSASNSLLGSVYVGYCSFILSGIDSDFNVTTRNQVYLDFLTRVANMTIVVDFVQDFFLRFASTLVNVATTLSRVQADALGSVLQQVYWRTFFTAPRIADVKDLYALLTKNLSGVTPGAVASVVASTGTTTSSNGAVVLESTTSIVPVTDAVLPRALAPAAPIAVSAVDRAIAQQQQQASARSFLNARANSWAR